MALPAPISLDTTTAAPSFDPLPIDPLPSSTSSIVRNRSKTVSNDTKNKHSDIKSPRKVKKKPAESETTLTDGSGNPPALTRPRSKSGSTTSEKHKQEPINNASQSNSDVPAPAHLPPPPVFQAAATASKPTTASPQRPNTVSSKSNTKTGSMRSNPSESGEISDVDSRISSKLLQESELDSRIAKKKQELKELEMKIEIQKNELERMKQSAISTLALEKDVPPPTLTTPGIRSLGPTTSAVWRALEPNSASPTLDKRSTSSIASKSKVATKKTSTTVSAPKLKTDNLQKPSTKSTSSPTTSKTISRTEGAKIASTSKDTVKRTSSAVGSDASSSTKKDGALKSSKTTSSGTTTAGESKEQMK